MNVFSSQQCHHSGRTSNAKIVKNALSSGEHSRCSPQKLRFEKSTLSNILNVFHMEKTIYKDTLISILAFIRGGCTTEGGKQLICISHYSRWWVYY